MTVKELQISGARKLSGAVMQPDFESDLLLSFVLGKNRAWLYGHPENKVASSKVQTFRKLVARRSKKEPFAYLTGVTEFFGLNLKVNKNVLIPRPETKNLVELALEIAKKNKIKSVADIGTGSGAIILALAKNLPKKFKFYGLEISSKALSVARKNASILKTKNVKFIKSDLLQKLPGTHPILITANLPYLDKEEVKSDELKHEPMLALSGGNDGLKLILKLIEEFKNKSRRGDFLVLEVGFAHEPKIRKIIKGLTFRALKDFNNVPRFIVIGR